MITRDLLAPGNYFWRVRALHGDVAGPLVGWARDHGDGPVAPPDVNLFAILAEPVNAYGGNTAHARVMLDNPAPAGGAVVSISTDIPQVNMPATTITVPAGRTDATISNIATGPGAEQWRRLGWNHRRFICRFRQWSRPEFVRDSSDSLRHEFEQRKRSRRNVGQRHCDIAKRCACGRHHSSASSAVIPISLGRRLPCSFPQAQLMSILQFRQAQLQLPRASSSKPAPTSMAIARRKPG
jgi:hypothetical protein